MNSNDAMSTIRVYSRTYLLAVAVVLLGSATATFAGDWTQWGGPNQAFIADSSGIASTWPEDGPAKLWSRELGEGYSGILFEDGRLYTIYRTDDQESVICLDAKTGKSIWEHKYASSPREGHEHQFGAGPRSTPLLSGNRLYTIGVAGLMHCLDKATGKKIWTRDLWTEFGGNVLNHGYSSSPIAYKDNVITLVGGKDQSVVALSKKDGSVQWKSLSFENSYSTPRLLKVDGEDQLVTFMATELIGLDPNNGKLKWQYAIKNQWKQNVCMPVMADEQHLFLSTSGAGARGLKLTQSGGETIVDELWSTRKIQFYHVSSVRVGDYVYGSTGSQSPAFMSAVNIKTGKIAWRKRGFAKANCVAADGKLIILDEDGNLALATATPDDFVVHSKFKLFDGVSWTVPTIVGKTLYTRDKRTIVALDLG